MSSTDKSSPNLPVSGPTTKKVQFVKRYICLEKYYPWFKYCRGRNQQKWEVLFRFWIMSAGVKNFNGKIAAATLQSEKALWKQNGSRWLFTLVSQPFHILMCISRLRGLNRGFSLFMLYLSFYVTYQWHTIMIDGPRDICCCCCCWRWNCLLLLLLLLL